MATTGVVVAGVMGAAAGEATAFSGCSSHGRVGGVSAIVEA